MVTQAQSGATINSSAIQTALTTYQSQVKTYIDTTKPNATMDDVLGSKTIVQKNNSILSGTLPYTRIATGGSSLPLKDAAGPENISVAVIRSIAFSGPSLY